MYLVTVIYNCHSLYNKYNDIVAQNEN